MKIDLRNNTTRVAQLNAVGHNLISYEEVKVIFKEIGD
jgi:hypothetical protein